MTEGRGRGPAIAWGLPAPCGGGQASTEHFGKAGRKINYRKKPLHAALFSQSKAVTAEPGGTAGLSGGGALSGGEAPGAPEPDPILQNFHQSEEGFEVGSVRRCVSDLLSGPY